MDGFSKFFILAARKWRKLSFGTLFRFVQWIARPQSSFERRVSEKKVQSVTVKVHILQCHVADFIEFKGGEYGKKEKCLDF